MGILFCFMCRYLAVLTEESCALQVSATAFDLYIMEYLTI